MLNAMVVHLVQYERLPTVEEFLTAHLMLIFQGTLPHHTSTLLCLCFAQHLLAKGGHSMLVTEGCLQEASVKLLEGILEVFTAEQCFP